MAKANFIGRVLGKSRKDTAQAVQAQPAAKARKTGSKIEYRREYDRLAYAKRTGKISQAAFAKQLKAAKVQYGIA